MPRAFCNISFRVYALLLFAYPADFRRTFGEEMLQVFRDCYRAELTGRRAGRVLHLWLHTLFDLVISAVKEHSARENSFMNNLRKDLVAVLGCAVIIVTAVTLLNYGRNHEVSSILIFGYFLDALASMGIAGNLIVFLLAKVTKLNSLRIAFWTFLVIHVVTLSLLLLIAGRNDPHFNLGGITIGYVVSFLFWIGLHWMWSKTMQTRPEPEDIR
jgi:hypothetical protein